MPIKGRRAKEMRGRLEGRKEVPSHRIVLPAFYPDVITRFTSPNRKGN